MTDLLMDNPAYAMVVWTRFREQQADAIRSQAAYRMSRTPFLCVGHIDPDAMAVRRPTSI